MPVLEEDLRRIADSGLFDVAFYGRQSGEIWKDEASAIRHYLGFGSERGLSPSAAFDVRYYLRRYSDVSKAGLDPLLHFILHGKEEGRVPCLGIVGSQSDKPVPPSEAQWEACQRFRAGAAETAPSIDVIVPVYRGYDDTLACLYSVLVSTNNTSYELVVIDDHSPEPQLSEELVRLAAKGLFKLIVNAVNLGFVRSVNAGMALHPDRDILLLNSDTVVYGDWLDRMCAQADADPRIGTVTPWSNNATIMSYPFFCEANNFDLEMDFADLDALVARLLKGKNVDVPTGVGFCFFIRRAVLDVVGPFDVERFGRGYGEENDFCLRGAEVGWRNVCALDVFVRHTGEVSFSQDAALSQHAGLKALLELYPGYHELIADFIAADPLQPYRAAIDLERLRLWCEGEGVLFIEHNWGGGIVKHTTDLAKLLAKEKFKVIRFLPVQGQLDRFVLAPSVPMDLPNLPSIAADDPAGAACLLIRLDLCFVHIHSLIGFHSSSIQHCTEMLERVGIKYYFTAHDYIPVCPRVTMIDWSGTYCDTPSLDYCQHCVDKAGTPFGNVDMADWRERYDRVIRGAERVLLPSHDTHDRMQRFFPDARFAVRSHPHVEKASLHYSNPTPLDYPDGGERIVGLIGAIGPHKGSGVLLRVAVSAFQRRLPMRFIIYGHSDVPELQELPNVNVLGAYEERAIDSLLSKNPCHLMFFASVWPETYCYTVSATIRNEIYPVCFDVGAPAERLKQLEFGAILPLSLAYAPDELADRLLTIPIGVMQDSSRLRFQTEGNWHSSRFYYDLIAGGT